jgi:hypothetical protein
MVTAFERGLVGRDVSSGPLHQGVAAQVQPQLLDDGRGNFILDGEDAVISLS